MAEVNSTTIESDDHTALVEALSRAAHVSENASFDPEQHPSLRQDMKVIWDTLFSNSAGSSAKLQSLHDAWFERIYNQHNQEGRYYHTAVHLKEMFDYLKVLETTSTKFLTQSQLILMQWATFFHDVVYNAQSSTNERDSAILFQEFAKEISLPPSIAESIVTFIHATEKHQVLSMNGVVDGDDALIQAQALFLDLDMAVLGKQKAAYLAYASLIRKEYAFVPHHIYCTKRAEVLQSFVGGGSASGNDARATKPIYLTSIFQEALEDRARNNLMQEIKLLQQGIIPGKNNLL